VQTKNIPEIGLLEDGNFPACVHSVVMIHNYNAMQENIFELPKADVDFSNDKERRLKFR
jgi:hypothetical protein